MAGGGHRAGGDERARRRIVDLGAGPGREWAIPERETTSDQNRPAREQSGGMKFARQRQVFLANPISFRPRNRFRLPSVT